MKKDILQKGIILPLIIGVILAFAFFIFLRDTTAFQPVAEKTQIAFHDDKSVDNEMVVRDDLKLCRENDNIGSIIAGDDSFIVRYNADYSNMINSVSFVDGAAFGDGVSYLEITSDIVDKIMSAEILSYSGTFGEHRYMYAGSKNYSGKYAVTADLPEINKGIVFIYQAKDNGGLSSKYTALFFEEAK